ncbi:DUF4280 domain-containing protein [Paenibacillus durus]|uniref:DUF4280 domain-containing protein n=1 Tax=Paenibacillus durus ATCC 35681 TaxID=1333534 RepID=A0A0F7FES6_PAEDU|nr:DUF4280 domain-containing protein [Paenibacillus durus]AKG37429.1 hypothetical protein VK70_25600 [Paenibacillus durus ATCC 35681]
MQVEGAFSVGGSGGEEQKSYVVAGAILSCSCGTQLTRLKIPFSHGVYVKEMPQVNVEDYKPGVNIIHFGNCTNQLNPAVKNGKFDTEGVQKAPCVPVITGPWVNGKFDVLIEEQPALLSHCTNTCIYEGSLIRIEDDGQDLGGVSVGSSGSGAIR